METQNYICLEKAIEIPAFDSLIKSGAYFPCIGSNSDGCSTLGKDPDTNNLRIGKRDIYGGVWSKVSHKDFRKIKVYPGLVVLEDITS